MTLSTTRRFPAPIRAAVHDSKILWIRAGTQHRFIGIWAVVVGDRVFVRSWYDTPTGWYRAFLEEPLGAIRIGERVVRVRARKVTGEKILDAVEKGYAEKYRTPANLQYVRGFTTARRRRTTMELIPR
jgi:hypothetical protein